MTLKVVGAGLGRTGTLSLKLALEQLGYGPCHHMVEVFAHPETIPLWVEARAGRPDWDAIFRGYSAAVDYPTAAFWREIAAHFPDAKVILSLREPESWFESTQATIFAPGSFADSPPPHLAPFFQAVAGPMAGHLHDREFMTEYFRRHTAEVEATIAPGRLLVWRAGEGWERLCAFLGVAVPDAPFPRVNDREEFVGRALLAREAAKVAEAGS